MLFYLLQEKKGEPIYVLSYIYLYMGELILAIVITDTGGRKYKWETRFGEGLLTLYIMLFKKYLLLKLLHKSSLSSHLLDFLMFELFKTCIFIKLNNI